MDQVTLLVQASLVFRDNVTGAKFQIMSSTKPQQAPAWVVNTDTYKAAFSQGIVHAINYVVPPVPAKDSTMPANVANALGFNGGQTPTIDSLTKAGMNVQDAQSALAAMEARKVSAETAAQVVTKELNPVAVAPAEAEAPAPKKRGSVNVKTA